MAGASHANIPTWTWIAPLLASLMLALKFTGVLPGENAVVLLMAGILLLAAVFAGVHHAEVLAVKLGEPFGSILLAVAVTIIEVALIVSIMLSGAPGSESVARDTVFAAVMIVLNGVFGVCLLLGARRHFEQRFQLRGASAALAVLGTLAALTLILPNFTLSAAGPYYAPVQLVAIGIMSLVLWAVFVFVQTIRHRDYFLDAAREPAEDEPDPGHDKPSDRVAITSLALLLVALTAVVLLEGAVLPARPRCRRHRPAKGLRRRRHRGGRAAARGLAAANSALHNRLQNSINLAIGSAIASIGLTVPTVAVVALILNTNIVLGISPANMTLLALTLFVSTLTLGTGRTTVLHGAVHLVLFAAFLLVSAVP